MATKTSRKSLTSFSISYDFYNRDVMVLWEQRLNEKSCCKAKCAVCKKELGESRCVFALVQEEHRQQLPLIFIDTCCSCAEEIAKKLSTLFSVYIRVTGKEIIPFEKVKEILKSNEIVFKVPVRTALVAWGRRRRSKVSQTS